MKRIRFKSRLVVNFKPTEEIKEEVLDAKDDFDAINQLLAAYKEKPQRIVEILDITDQPIVPKPSPVPSEDRQEFWSPHPLHNLDDR